MSIGKLYRFNDEQFIANISYQFHNESATSWWGELTLTEYKRFNSSGEYVIELKDGRRGRCFLKKKVNKAVAGFLPLYCYTFRANGPLE